MPIKKRDGKKPAALMRSNDKLDCGRDGTGTVPYDGVQLAAPQASSYQTAMHYISDDSSL